MVIKIPLRDGYYTTISDWQAEKVLKYRWYLEIRSNSPHVKCPNGVNHIYAVTFKTDKRGKRKKLYLHQLITNCPGGMVVHHKDHNGLNNEDSNMEVCTQSENAKHQNRNFTKTKWGDFIVYNKVYQAYQPFIDDGINKTTIGFFDSDIAAVLAYNEEQRKRFGENADIIDLDDVKYKQDYYRGYAWNYRD